MSLYARLWLRVHEVEDHGGAECDCPTEEETRDDIRP